MSQTRFASTFCVLAFTSLVACSSSERTATATDPDRPTSMTETTKTNSTKTDAMKTGTLKTDGDGSFRSSNAYSDSSTGVDVDNTAMNKRDRNGNAMTADRQSEGTRSDVDITREIRQQLVKDDSLSSSAKNVKIITKNGIVNLRGPVANPTERSKIASIAQNIAGVANVRNSLEVKKQ